MNEEERKNTIERLIKKIMTLSEEPKDKAKEDS